MEGGLGFNGHVSEPWLQTCSQTHEFDILCSAFLLKILRMRAACKIHIPISLAPANPDSFRRNTSLQRCWQAMKVNLAAHPVCSQCPPSLQSSSKTKPVVCPIEHALGGAEVYGKLHNPNRRKLQRASNAGISVEALGKCFLLLLPLLHPSHVRWCENISKWTQTIRSHAVGRGCPYPMTLLKGLSRSYIRNNINRGGISPPHTHVAVVASFPRCLFCF